MNLVIKRIISVVFAICLFLSIGSLLRYILVDDTESYTRVMMHQMYESEKNIDIAFVGSSHVYRSFVPEITDKRMKGYTFNAGSSSQCMDGSYAMIRELCSHHNVKDIYLELYYGIAESSEYDERSYNTSTYILSDYMKPSLRKLKFLCDSSSKECWTDGFILARRNWKDLFNGERIISLLRKKNAENYKNYQLSRTDNPQYYVDRGFVANDSVLAEDAYWNSQAWGEIDKAVKLTAYNDWYQSLLNIIVYCQKKNVNLIFFIAPEPEQTIVGKGNYQKYHDFIRSIANKYNIAFYDFNFCKSSYFDTNDRKMFMDADHLNTQGAERFSELFSDFFMNKISEDELFYNTLNEKLETEEPHVYGLAGPCKNSESDLSKGYIISNRESELEYKIEIRTDSGEEKLIQDYSVNKYFSLPAEEHGTLKVYWRVLNETGTETFIETTY